MRFYNAFPFSRGVMLLFMMMVFNQGVHMSFYNNGCIKVLQGLGKRGGGGCVT